MFKRILIPIEIGEAADDVVRIARKLAAEGACARLVHVLTNDTTLFFADLMNLERFTERAQHALDALRTRHAQEGVFDIDTKLREGKVDKELLAEASEFEADAIVVGSHGRRGLQRFLLGSVAERVLHGAQVPVCVTKGTVPASRFLEHVVLATDLEADISEATDAFIALAEQSGARGTLAHVFRSQYWLSAIPLPGPVGSAGYYEPVATEQIEGRVQTRRAEAGTRLEEAAAKIKERGLDRVTTELLDGDPWSEIADMVDDGKADLLILGTHHYGTLDRFMLGSVAEKMLRAVDCPVLIVPHLVQP